MNSAQVELTDAFVSLATHPAWHRPDALILGGDAIDGPNKKSSGVGTWSTQVLDQVKAAEELARMFDARFNYVLGGSNYHVKVDGLPLEEILARDLNAVPIGEGEYRSAIRLMLVENDYQIHFAHHIPVSQSDWYLTTPLAKEGIRIKLKEGTLGHVGAIFRAHNHQWIRSEFRSQHLISAPCWKLPDDYLYKKGGEPNVDIGAVRFVLFDEPDDFGEIFRIQKQLFPIKASLPAKSTPSRLVDSEYDHWAVQS